MLYLIIVTGSCTFLNRAKLFLYYINMQILTEESNMQIKKMLMYLTPIKIAQEVWGVKEKAGIMRLLKVFSNL
jgi:hypothetical protein